MSANSYEWTEDKDNIVSKVTNLPHRILNHHEVDSLHQIVLHELGHDNCFGLKRAVYLVDNPDFDHLRGVAGFCKSECHHHKDDLWKDPYAFKNDMKDAHFHKDASSYLKASFKRKDINLHDSSEVKDLGKQMGLKNPNFVSWNMKHGNHGLLVFDQDKNLCVWRHGLLYNAAALLSLCGI